MHSRYIHVVDIGDDPFFRHHILGQHHEPRISGFEIYTPEEIVPGPEVLEEDFYKTISKNIKQFIEDADNEI